MDPTAMAAEREALRLGVENLMTLFPVEAKEFQFVVKFESRETKYKVDTQSLRLFGFCNDHAEDVHRADANRLERKRSTSKATEKFTKWDKYPELFSACLAWSICPKYWPSVNAARVSNLIQEREKNSRRWFAPYFTAKLKCIRGKKHGEAQWQQDHWKAKDALGAAIKQAKSQAYKDGRRTRSTHESQAEHLWRETTVCIWTPSPRSTINLQQRTSSDYDTKIRSLWFATITIKLVRWRMERITSLLREPIQVYKIKKDALILSCRNMKDLDADPSTNSWELTWNGEAKLGGQYG